VGALTATARDHRPAAAGARAAGAFYAQVEKRFGTASAAVVAGVLIIALIVWRVREHRAGRDD